MRARPRDGVFRIRDDEVRRCVRKRTRWTGRFRIHRRHWRALRPVRSALCDKLAWLGMKLDKQANASNGPRISLPDSACRSGHPY